nr:hypothetical protein [Tanacetum cinerariifolium]
MSSSSSHATVTYTSMSSHSLPWVFHLMSGSDSEAPEAAPQSPAQAPLSLSHALVYTEYVAPSDNDPLPKDRPLAASASPTALSPDYLADSELVEDDPKEDLVDYPSEEEEEEPSDDEEEEPLDLTLSASLVLDFVPSSEEIEPYEEGETAANEQRAPKESHKTVTCFECGKQRNYKKDCPKLKNRGRENSEARGRVYALGENNANPDSNVVKDIKEKGKIKAKTKQNQEQTESMEKSKVKPDKVKAQSKPKSDRVTDSPFREVLDDQRTLNET